MNSFIILLGFVLRFPFLNQSLWLDEAIEAIALQGKVGPLLTYALADFQPPLYHLILNVWTKIFGFSEIALRFPSFLAGLLTIYLGAKLGELFNGKKTGLIAGLLFATNPLLIYYSTEGRTYSITTAFVTASFYFLFRYLKNHSNRDYFLFILTTALYLWTSYLSWFLTAILFLYFVLTRHWKIALGIIVASFTLIFWLPSLWASLNIGISTINNSSGWGVVVGGISPKALALTWVKFLLGRISFDNKLIYVFVVGFVTFLHLSALKMLKNTKIQTLYFVWLFAPIILSAFVAIFLPIYQYFRLLFVLPSYLILLSFALTHHNFGQRLLIVIVFIQFLAVAYFAFNQDLHKENWRQLVKTYGSNAHYALPSLNQAAPLIYYGVPLSQQIEPKAQNIPSVPKIIYIRYAEELFDQAGLGRANLKASGYTMTSEQNFTSLAVEEYSR